jgi:hypothetical protein
LVTGETIYDRDRFKGGVLADETKVFVTSVMAGKMTYLSRFDMHFQFLPGKKNIIADLLSHVAERYPHNLPYLNFPG